MSSRYNQIEYVTIHVTMHLEVHRVADDEAIKYFLLEFVLM